MLTEEQALYYWQDFAMAGTRVCLERVRSSAVGSDPWLFRLAVNAKMLSGKQIAEVLKESERFDAEVGLDVRDGDPYLVLS